LNALEPAKTGPRPKERNPPEAELKQVQKEKRTLERRLKRAELLLEIPKKASELTRSSTFQNHLRHGIRPGLPDHVPIQSPECSRKRPGH